MKRTKRDVDATAKQTARELRPAELRAVVGGALTDQQQAQTIGTTP